MKQPCVMLVLALAVLGQAAAHATIAKKVSSMESWDPRISPPLKDVKSDKKFFGPNGDYASDKRPLPDKSIMDKLKGPGQPYPALQSKEDYDTDFVKDENSDKGAWQAQFEYDALRKKLADEEAAVRRAQERADRAGSDVDGAQKNADDAAGKVGDAQKNADDALHGEEDIKRAEDFGGPPSDEKLKELKKAVEAAEERYAQQKKAFEECERQLLEAKKDLEDLKGRQKDLEEDLASSTKLWVEQNQKQKTIKLNLKKSKESAALEKTKAAQAKLDAALKIKAEAEKALAKEKSESEESQKKLVKEKADLDKAQKDLDKASTRLQVLHGYKPATPAAAPTKSSAPVSAVGMTLFLSMIVATRAF